MRALQQVPSWLRCYVGLPYREKGRDHHGVDCYGLLWCIYAERLGELLPRYDEPESYSESSDKSVNEILTEECVESPKWEEVPPESTTFGDLLLFNIRGKPRHVGLCISNQLMIHTLQGHNSAVERWTSKKWRCRLAGVYRRTH